MSIEAGQDPQPDTSDSPAPESSSEAEPVPPGGPVGALVALALLVGLVLTAFVLPAIHSAPHEVPLGVAGPTQAVAQVSTALGERARGAFAPKPYADEAALVQAIKDRDVYGGIVLTQEGPKVLTATAGSPAVALTLSSMAIGLDQQQGRPVPVVDVVAPPAGDPRGAGVTTAILPLLIGAIAPVVAMRRILRGRWRQLLGVLASAVVIGATIAGLLVWYGAVDSWFLPAAGLSLSLAAMSTALLGLATVSDWAGMGLGVAVFLLLGNPLSGIATAPEFVPAGWSVLGALLPPGAAGQVLRSDFYFDGAGANTSVVVLVGWIVLGLALIAAGDLKVGRRQAAASPA